MALKALITFGAGLVSFLSPCVLPLLPGYVGYMTGSGATERPRPARALAGTLSFVAGLAAVFVALGATASVLSQLLAAHKHALELASGAIVVVMGTILVLGPRLPLLTRERRFHLRPGGGAGRAFLLGAAFAFGWTPCIGPTLAAALNLAATSRGLGEGVLLLLSYALGIGLPFAAAGLGLLSVGGRMKRHAATIQLAGGVVLVAIGVLMITGRLTLITIDMQRLFRRLHLDLWNV